ncbi:MAG TPA: intradiol ring-cleavage dioxygenase [Burkholderiales bacterium]|nr:intradiol ring-cleavage dioxygenase [Burkholderiales bacterium]
MKDDDRASGRILQRRDALAWLGAAGFAAFAAQPSRRALAAAARSGSSCVVTPAQTEGPYFVDERLNRSDIRSDPSDGSLREGVPLALDLTIAAVGAGGCTPLAGATVDLWHCDAHGVYSDTRDPSYNSAGKKFLRGYQVTDAGGRVAFTTIYPGWYAGRAVHIHFKVRGRDAAGRGYEFTSQAYFDDTVTDRVFARAPYAARSRNRLRNEGDFGFRDGGGRLMLALAEHAGGYGGSFDVGIKVG